MLTPMSINYKKNCKRNINLRKIDAKNHTFISSLDPSLLYIYILRTSV
jgi:hypothetical protein